MINFILFVILLIALACFVVAATLAISGAYVYAVMMCVIGASSLVCGMVIAWSRKHIQ